MGTEFTFHDYVDSRERNVVDAWLRGDVPTAVREKFNEQLNYLEATPRGKWSRPYVRPVGDGLLEARVIHASQYYRILFTHMPGRKPTLLHGFNKRGEKLPEAHRTRALNRKAELVADPVRHQMEHSYE